MHGSANLRRNLPYPNQHSLPASGYRVDLHATVLGIKLWQQSSQAIRLDRSAFRQRLSPSVSPEQGSAQRRATPSGLYESNRPWPFRSVRYACHLWPCATRGGECTVPARRHAPNCSPEHLLKTLLHRKRPKSVSMPKRRVAPSSCLMAGRNTCGAEYASTSLAPA